MNFTSNSPSVRPLNINELPVELLLKIFSYSSHKCLSQCLVKVCKLWHNIGMDPLLWRSLAFNTRHAHISKRSSVLYIIENSVLLKSLDSPYSTFVNEILEVVSKNCPLLEELNIGFTELPSVKRIKSLVLMCPNITKLNLEGTTLSYKKDELYLMYFESFAQMSNLKFLNLSHCMWVSDHFVTLLAKSTCCLEYFNIEGIPYVTPKSMECFLQLKYAHLKSLLLDGEALTDIIFQQVKNCELLKEFSILFSENASDESFQQFLSLKHLTSIKIRKGFALTADGIVNSLKTNDISNIIQLDLSECHLISDDAVEIIANSCTNLELLRLDWCMELTNAGLIHVVCKSNNLLEMSLVGLGRINSSLFIDVPPKLSNLIALDLQQCNLIADEEVCDLVRRNPTLVVWNYWGDFVESSLINAQPDKSISS